MYKLFRESDKLYLVAISEITKNVLTKQHNFVEVQEKPHDAKEIGNRRKGV